MIIKVDDCVISMYSYSSVEKFVTCLKDMAVNVVVEYSNMFDCYTIYFNNCDNKLIIRGVEICFNQIYIDKECINFNLNIKGHSIIITTIYTKNTIYDCDFIELDI